MTLTDSTAAQTVPPSPPTNMTNPPTRSNISPLNRWALAARMAWREVKHRRGRSLLVVALIAAPTMLMTIGAIGIRSDPGSNFGNDQDFGTGDISFQSNLDTASATSDYSFDKILATMPEGTTSAQFVWVGGRVTLSDTVGAYATFTDIDLDNPLTDRLEIVSGRAPASGEMMLSANLANALDVKIGDEVNMVRPSGTWTLSGVVRDPIDNWNEVVLVDSFEVSRLRNGGEMLVVELPDSMTSQEIQAFSGAGRLATKHVNALFCCVDDGPSSGTLAVWWLLGALAFMAFGIIVTAAFATNARGQLVSVAHLAANGAPQSTITKMLALQGWWTGLLGGVAGVAAALALAPILKGPAEEYFYDRSVQTVIRPTDLVVVILTAMAAGTLAAMVPGRSLAKTSVLDALAGRRPEGRVPQWLVPSGFALFGLGLLMVLAAVTASRNYGLQTTTTATMILGVAGMGLGVCAVTPWIVERLGRVSGRLRLAPRMALRAMARSRARSAAVISAIAVTAAVATVIAAAVQHQTNTTQDDYMARDSFLVTLEPDWDGISEFAPTDVTVPAATLDQINLNFPDAKIEPSLTAYKLVEDGQDRYIESVPIATDAAIHAFRWNDTGLAALEKYGYVIAGGVEEIDTGGPGLPVDQGGSSLVLPEVVPGGTDTFGGVLLMTVEFADANGFTVVTSGVAMSQSTDFTQAQHGDLVEIQDSLWSSEDPAQSIFVEPGDDLATAELQSTPGFWQIQYQSVDFHLDRTVLTGRLVAFGLALFGTALVVAIGLALAAADSKRDREILVVAGAKPSLMRRLSAVDAATMALVGILLGIPAGYFPARAVVAAESRGGYVNGLDFPWVFAIALVAVVPLVLAAAAWLFTRPRAHVSVSPG